MMRDNLPQKWHGGTLNLENITVFIRSQCPVVAHAPLLCSSHCGKMQMHGNANDKMNECNQNKQDTNEKCTKRTRCYKTGVICRPRPAGRCIFNTTYVDSVQN